MTEHFEFSIEERDQALALYTELKEKIAPSLEEDDEGRIRSHLLHAIEQNMVKRDTSFITLIYGEDVSEDDAQKAYEELRDRFGSRTDISLVKGDQPIYYYILSAE